MSEHNDNNLTPEQAPDENQIFAERRGKLARMREAGVAFPNDFVPSHRAGPLQAEHGEAEKAALDPKGIEVSVFLPPCKMPPAVFSSTSTTKGWAKRSTRNSSIGT